ncbi:hypothetical protein BDW68DRAFT_182245 [Aspergillus falconensis]
MAAQAEAEKRGSVSEVAGQINSFVDLEKSAAAGQFASRGRYLPRRKGWVSLAQFWIVICGLNVGMLLAALDFNIFATAVPIVSSEFNAYNNSSCLGTGFLITFCPRSAGLVSPMGAVQ